MLRQKGQLMNTGRRVTRWSRIAAAGSMATAMLISVAACSSYTPRAHEEPAPSAGETTTGAPAPAAGISAAEAQVLLATVNCEAGALSGAATLSSFAGTGIAAAAYCVGDPLAVTMYDGDLADLASLLARPDDTTPPEEGISCDSYVDWQPNLWIVTSDGALMQPRWPLDNCGHLLQPVPPQITGAAYEIPEEAPVVPEEQPVYEQEYVEEPVYDVPIEEPAN